MALRAETGRFQPAPKAVPPKALSGFGASLRYLMHFLPITLVAACRAVAFCSKIPLRPSVFPSHETAESRIS